MLVRNVKKQKKQDNSVIAAQLIQELNLIPEIWVLTPVTSDKHLYQKLCIQPVITTLQQTGGAV